VRYAYGLSLDHTARFNVDVDNQRLIVLAALTASNAGSEIASFSYGDVGDTGHGAPQLQVDRSTGEVYLADDVNGVRLLSSVSSVPPCR
jgi:hypothetical protein